MPDATELLQQDHRKVEGLFERYQAGDQSVVPLICEELAVHTELEEEHVYPLLQKIDGGEELRQQAEKEHQEVKNAIDKLARTGADSDIEQLMQAIIEGVMHHVQEEEKEVLPQLAQEIGPERMESLGEELLDAKRRRRVPETDLDDLSKSELYHMAQAANVNGRSSMTKHQLREALRS